MIEPYIEGKELTVSVIEEEKKSQAVQVTEIISNNLFLGRTSERLMSSPNLRFLNR